MKETAATVAGDPTADGATLHIQLTPGGDQCVTMPALSWVAISTIGFRYKDATLANGPVKVASRRVRMRYFGTTTVADRAALRLLPASAPAHDVV